MSPPLAAERDHATRNYGGELLGQAASPSANHESPRDPIARRTRVISFGSDVAFAWDVALDADGRAIAVGWTLISPDKTDIAIARVR